MRRVRDEDQEEDQACAAVRGAYVKMNVNVETLKLGWQFLENGNPKELSTLTGLEEDIPGLLLDTIILTFPQRHVEPLSSCMCETILDSQLPEIMDELEGRPETGPDIFPKESSVPEELRDAPMVEFQGQAGGHEEQPESVWVNGKELSRQSKVKDLQDGWIFLE